MNIAVHQDPRLNIIPYDNMQQAIKFMITQFLDANGNQPPSKIIWYRGGASVGSLQTILKNEFLGKSAFLLMDLILVFIFSNSKDFGKLATRLQTRNHFHLHCSKSSSEDVRSK